MGNCVGKNNLRMEDSVHKEMSVVDVDGSEPGSSKQKGPDPYMEGIREYLHAEWRLADKDYSGRLSFNEIQKLLKKLNVGAKGGIVKERFKRVDKLGSGQLDFNEFCAFLEELRTRPELKAIFDTFSKGKHFWTVKDFVLFLHQEQFEIGVDEEAALRLIKRIEKSEAATKLYFNAFSEYMVSDENSGYNYMHRSATYQEMNHPLTHYYIASSHNTYIESHQLKGNSSVEAYISALKRGCKCVELDIWDGDDGQPIITHGHTMTSRIKFRDVVQAVKDYAFCVSPYPTILSLENHCSERQQRIMADIFNEILGSAGLLPPHLLDQPNPLPSPEQLKHKILIKGKVLSLSPQPPEDDEFEDEEEFDIFEEYEDMGDSSAKVGESIIEQMSSMPNLPSPTLTSLSPQLSPQLGSRGYRASKRYSRRVKEKLPPLSPSKSVIAKELSDMMHLKPVIFQGFQNAKDKNAAWEMSSFTELKVQQFFKFEREKLVEYNINQFTRIYPKGTRFDSSNYPPMVSWSGGCQMTALNYQTDSAPMWLNMGKFMDNGGIGYVLKPATLLTTSQLEMVRKVREAHKMLHVHLISGWQLPNTSTTKGDIIDPYVKIKMYGAPGDNNKYKTKVIQDDGFNPSWNEKVSFDLTRSDLAQILFEVFDQDKISKDDFLGYASIPVTSIKQGYRSIQLYDKKSVPIPGASLFVHLMLT